MISPVAGIEHEEDAHDLAVAGMDLQMVRAPSNVRAQRDDDAVMRSAGPLGSMALQRQAVMLHDSQHTFDVDRRAALGP
jgi:hypothetical protein